METDKILEELIEVFENATLEQNTASREKSAKSAAEVEKGRGNEATVFGDHGRVCKKERSKE